MKLLSNDKLVKVDPLKLNFFANFGKNNLQLITNWQVDEESFSEWPYSIILKTVRNCISDFRKKTIQDN